MGKSNGEVNGGFENGSVIELRPNGKPESISVDEKTDEDEKERPTWSNGVEFLMSCISLSVGLGNVWRFPYVAYENGGGAFLIPYIIVLFIIGKPLYYLEMTLGQFTSRSSIKAWSVNPLFKGVGIGQLVATWSVITYYTSLIALTLYYLFSSMASELPWDKCWESWTDCVDSKPNGNFTLANNNNTQLRSSSELYFTKIVIAELNDIKDGIGIPSWKLTLYLLLAWTVVFLVIIRGVKSSGKVAYFLALFPYVVMITLLVRAVTLEGSIDGILYFITPQWSELLNPQVWKEAIVQVFFSLAVGMGPIIMFASYNKFHTNVYRDALIVTTLDTFTSLLGGFTMFGILGNLAHNLGIKDIDAVVRSGTGLAFISYPDAISKFEVVPQVFAVLFFFMLFVLGIGSVVALHSTICTVICDTFPKLKYWHVASVACLVGFVCGILYVTPGGQWMLDLVDHFGGTFLVFVLAIFELAGIFWVYGLENYCLDVQFMTKRTVGIYWRICWAIITPIFMLIIFIYNMATLKPPTHGGFDFPPEAIAAGWILFSIGLIQVPIWALWLVLRKENQPFFDKVVESSKPTDVWGPKNTKIKMEWVQYKKDAIEKRRKTAETNNHSYMKQKLFILLGKYDYE